MWIVCLAYAKYEPHTYTKHSQLPVNESLFCPGVGSVLEMDG